MITARTIGSVGRCVPRRWRSILQPRIRDGGEHDMMLPAGIGASLEMIEPEFVLEFLILLLDRPPLMREP